MNGEKKESNHFKLLHIIFFVLFIIITFFSIVCVVYFFKIKIFKKIKKKMFEAFVLYLACSVSNKVKR